MKIHLKYVVVSCLLFLSACKPTPMPPDPEDLLPLSPEWEMVSGIWGWSETHELDACPTVSDTNYYTSQEHGNFVMTIDPRKDRIGFYSSDEESKEYRMGLPTFDTLEIPNPYLPNSLRFSTRLDGRTSSGYLFVAYVKGDSLVTWYHWPMGVGPDGCYPVTNYWIRQ